MTAQQATTTETPELVATTPAPVHLDPPKPPRNIGQASDLLEKVGDSERCIRLLSAMYGRRIARLQNRITALETQRDEQIAPHLEFVALGVKLLATWCKNSLKKHGEGRTISLPSGELKCELDRNWSVTVNDDEVETAIAKVRRRGLRYVNISVSLDKKAITKDRRRFRFVKELVFSRKDRFRAVPTNLGKTEKPKVDRLSVPLKTVYYPPRRSDITPSASAD